MTQTNPDQSHRVTVTGHEQPHGKQWRVACTCGWAEWNVHPHGAQEWAAAHQQANQ